MDNKTWCLISATFQPLILQSMEWYRYWSLFDNFVIFLKGRGLERWNIMKVIKRSVTNSPVVFINRSIIPCVKLPNWWSPILNSTHFEFHPLMKSTQRWENFTWWTSTWWISFVNEIQFGEEFKMGEHHFGNFTLGIIDLLMNNSSHSHQRPAVFTSTLSSQAAFFTFARVCHISWSLESAAPMLGKDKCLVF